jgi:hypothetical protein
MATEAEQSRLGAHQRILRLVYAALLALAVLYCWLVAVAFMENHWESWLWKVLNGEILLWMMVVFILGDILLLVVARLTDKRWLRWSTVAAAIALTASYWLIVYLLWLNQSLTLSL